MLAGHSEQSIKLNVHDYIAPATLEAIGEGKRVPIGHVLFVNAHVVLLAAFDYKLGVLDDKTSELGAAYKNLV